MFSKKTDLLGARVKKETKVIGAWGRKRIVPFHIYCTFIYCTYIVPFIFSFCIGGGGECIPYGLGGQTSIFKNNAKRHKTHCRSQLVWLLTELGKPLLNQWRSCHYARGQMPQGGKPPKHPWHSRGCCRKTGSIDQKLAQSFRMVSEGGGTLCKASYSQVSWEDGRLGDSNLRSGPLGGEWARSTTGSNCSQAWDSLCT